MAPSNVTVGLGTKLGLGASLASGVLAIVLAVEHNQALLTGANKPAALIAFASPILTALGRMYQAAHLPGAATVAKVTDDVPAALQALAAEAQKNVAVVQAHPDGVDGPHVAYSGVEQPTAPVAPAPTAP